MNSIYSYTDYRIFLKDFLENKKAANSRYSLRMLSDKCGFKARDFILRLINGQRNLSKSGIFKLCEGMKLSKKEAGYFEDLVSFNQAKTTREKEHYFQKISEARRYGKQQKLREEQFECFSQWYYTAIRSLLPVMDFKDDFSALGRYLDPPVSASQAKKAVALLLRLGLLEKEDSGNYRVSTPSLTTGDEVKSLALALFHKTILDLGKRSIDVHSAYNRDISGVTMSVSRGGFARIKSEIQSFRKKMMAIAESDREEDRVVQLDIQCFPLSKTGRNV